MARVTLQTIADRLGVSRMTVSNAFSRPDQLSGDLRDRILTTANELGYVGPDPTARAAGPSAAKMPAPIMEPRPITTASKTPRLRLNSPGANGGLSVMHPTLHHRPLHYGNRYRTPILGFEARRDSTICHGSAHRKAPRRLDETLELTHRHQFESSGRRTSWNSWVSPEGVGGHP